MVRYGGCPVKYNPEDSTSGLKRRPCQHCGKLGHEHKTSTMECPDD